MPTTIQVQKDTLELLKHVRESTQAQSYDTAIKALIKKAMIKTESLYGFLGKKTMQQILQGLRDENDRI